jgi:hypothetical protein
MASAASAKVDPEDRLSRIGFAHRLRIVGDDWKQPYRESAQSRAWERYRPGGLNTLLRSGALLQGPIKLRAARRFRANQSSTGHRWAPAIFIAQTRCWPLPSLCPSMKIGSTKNESAAHAVRLSRPACLEAKSNSCMSPASPRSTSEHAISAALIQSGRWYPQLLTFPPSAANDSNADPRTACRSESRASARYSPLREHLKRSCG